MSLAFALAFAGDADGAQMAVDAIVDDQSDLS